MKILIALLILALCCLFVAQVQAQDAGEVSGKENETMEHPATTSNTEDSDCLFSIQELEESLRDSEKQVCSGLPVTGKGVAFGAALGKVGHIGPFNTDLTLPYRVVFTNTGAYNNQTGIFRAPVRGIYYFNYSGHNLSTKPLGLQLMKNGVIMITVFNHIGGSPYVTATNGITLQLEVGDQVYMRLMKHTWIVDNVLNHSTFSGFLLFPL